MPGDIQALVDEGQTALANRDFAAARRSFEAAAASGEPAAFEGLGWAAWWMNDGEAAIEARQRAFSLYRDRHDLQAAGRAAIWLGCDHYDFRGEEAVANGWYQRAHRLLAQVPTCGEHAWLAFQEGAYALELADDTRTARDRAESVADIASRLGLADLEFLALGLDGLALVTEGAIDEGMRRLDEVGVAVTSGEFQDRVAITWMLCYLIYACERVRDFERASQWCVRMQEMSLRLSFELGMGVCRAHYGGVLVFHGKWELAESELLAAGDILARSRPLVAVESTVRLAELRRRQGRTDEAAELFAQSVPHPLAVIGLAGLALAGGDPAGAAEMLDDLLAVIPATSITQRADALELVVRAGAALGDRQTTSDATKALEEIATVVRTKPLRAMASWARATMAILDGNHLDARRSLAEAVDLFDNAGLPYEADCARIELAHALSRAHRTAAAEQHARRAADRLRVLGALYAAQQADQAIRIPAESPPASASSPLSGLSPREIEVLGLLAQGLSDREIGHRLRISVHTAHRHVSNILTKLGSPTRAAAAAVAGRYGVPSGRDD